MGAHLARLCLHYCPDDMPPAPRLVLVVMCLQALDSDRGQRRGGLYFGGWEDLARHLGYPTYGNAGKLAVKRAMRALIAAKLVERWDVGPGGRVAYRLLPYVPGKHHPGGIPHRDPWAG
jgi:hypothetical protein